MAVIHQLSQNLYVVQPPTPGFVVLNARAMASIHAEDMLPGDGKAFARIPLYGKRATGRIQELVHVIACVVYDMDDWFVMHSITPGKDGAPTTVHRIAIRWDCTDGWCGYCHIERFDAGGWTVLSDETEPWATSLFALADEYLDETSIVVIVN